MAFTGGYTLVQNDETTVTLTDASTDYDPNITQRRISFIEYNTTTLVPTGTNTTYILWPVVDGFGDEISVANILNQDYALNVQVNWDSTDPEPSGTYVANQLYNFDFYGMLFLAGLTTEDQARYPTILNDTNYMYRKFQLYCYIISSRISVGLMNDIFKAQFCLNAATNMRLNQNDFF